MMIFRDEDYQSSLLFQLLMLGACFISSFLEMEMIFLFQNINNVTIFFDQETSLTFAGFCF